jgi:antitoxin YefM
MKTMSVEEAQTELGQLVERAARFDELVEIRTAVGAAILISEDHWRNIQETVYLLSIPGVGESIIEGMHDTLEQAVAEKDLDW